METRQKGKTNTAHRYGLTLRGQYRTKVTYVYKEILKKTRENKRTVNRQRYRETAIGNFD